MKSNKKLLWFFILLFIGILVFIASMNRINRRQIKEKFAQVTMAEGVTIGHLLEVSGLHLAELGLEELTGFLDRLYRNPSIVYIGLFQGEQLHYLLSRFEGFFPVVPEQEKQRILDTPAGKIFEISSRFDGLNQQGYRLYIGFDYEFLTSFEDTMSKSFLFVVGLFAFVMLMVVVLVFYFDKKFYNTELELVREKQEKERFKELSLLTAEIAHEIKNPLNSIYLSFNTLETYLSHDDDALFYQEAIKDEIRRISNILQSYADLSNEIRPNWTTVDLKKFADTFQFLTKEEVESSGVRLTVEVIGSKKFRTDEDLLKQVLLNLFKNSLEAYAMKIDVQFILEGGTLTLTVSDDGKGIDESMRDVIFKPYVSGKTKGMGLGLHITKRQVEALGGEIQLLYLQAGKTSFRVTLPAAKKFRQNKKLYL